MPLPQFAFLYWLPSQNHKGRRNIVVIPAICMDDAIKAFLHQFPEAYNVTVRPA